MNRLHPTTPSPGNTGHPKGYRPQALKNRRPTLRAWLSRYAGAISILAMVVLIGAVCKILFSDPRRDALSPIPSSGSALFFDLASGKLVPAPDNLPGATTINAYMKTGLIRAYVLSCDACAEPERKTIYYEVFTQSAIQKLKSLGIQTYTQLTAEQPAFITQQLGPNSRYIRLPTDNRWVDLDSRDSKWILAGMSDFRCPGGKQPILCLK